MVFEWMNLPVRINGLIIDKMDLITRTRLKLTSSKNKQLVDERIYRPKIVKLEHDLWYQKAMAIRLEIDNDVMIWFEGMNDMEDTRVTIYREEKIMKVMMVPATMYYRVAFDYFQMLILKENVVIDTFSTTVPFHNTFMENYRKIRAKEIKTQCAIVRRNLPEHRGYVTRTVVNTEEWLLNCDLQLLKSVEVLDVCMFPSWIESIASSNNVKSLTISRHHSWNDRFLIECNYDVLSIRTHNITPQGVNQLIKKWLKENDTNRRMCYSITIPFKCQDKKAILQDLRVEEVYTDDVKFHVKIKMKNRKVDINVYLDVLNHEFVMATSFIDLV